MTTIFIDGEAGTTGLQIRDRLKTREDIELVSIAADKRKDPNARRELLNSVDVAILCLPDEAAKEAVSLIDAKSKTRVIDASTAYRVDSAWAYGFPELSPAQTKKIASASRVSNPGCYPQGFIAVVKPLIEAGVLGADAPLTYNAVSGYSGGGKKMIEDFEKAGTKAPPYLPYGLTLNHKHLAEMKLYAGLAHDAIFQPVVGNYAQGMLGTVPLFMSLLKKKISVADIHEILAKTYASSTFIEVAPLEAIERSAAVDPQALNNTNRMRLCVFGNDGRGQVLLTSIYDNLGKGASGAAVQNLNLMIGANESLGVDLPVAN
ncbi:MAG TPA: N-acetyl-gamma-glutamyl-phosphate reductase [Aestuariivirga sp.]